MFSEIKAHRQAGFSLIELLVVVLIIGILATIAIPSLLKQRDKAKNAGAQATVRSALTAAKSYYTEQGSFAGLTGTLLAAEERTLKAGAITDMLPGDTADAAEIYLAEFDGTAFNEAATATTTEAQQLILCSASKGDTVFCIKDDERAGTTQFGKLKKSNWAATAATATEIQGGASPNIVYGDKF